MNKYDFYYLANGYEKVSKQMRDDRILFGVTMGFTYIIATLEAFQV